MNIADLESWWLQRGHFDIQLYINYLRAKNAHIQDNTQRQDLPHSEGIRQAPCLPDSGPMDRTNFKN